MATCIYCDDTKRYKQPKSQEDFDKIFDAYYDGGQFSAMESSNKAYNKVGYTIIECPFCTANKN